MFKFFRGLKEAFLLGFNKGVADYEAEHARMNEAQRAQWCADFVQWYQTTEPGYRSDAPNHVNITGFDGTTMRAKEPPPAPCPECVYFFDGTNYWHQCDKSDRPVRSNEFRLSPKAFEAGRNVLGYTRSGSVVEGLPAVKDNAVPFRPRIARNVADPEC